MMKTSYRRSAQVARDGDQADERLAGGHRPVRRPARCSAFDGQECRSAFRVGVTSPDRNDRPIITSAIAKYAHSSAVFSGRKFEYEPRSTSRSKSHSTAASPPPSRRYRRAEYENLDCAMPTTPYSRWTTLCSTDTWKMPSTIAPEP